VIHSTGYVLVPDVLVEPLGDHWVAFSPSSGESHLINDTSAAIVEMLSCESALTLKQACTALAAEVGTLPADTEGLVHEALQTFVRAGLVRAVRLPRDTHP